MARKYKQKSIICVKFVFQDPGNLQQRGWGLDYMHLTTRYSDSTPQGTQLECWVILLESLASPTQVVKELKRYGLDY